MELHEILKSKRLEKKFTQKNMADKLFLSDKTYSQYERGERNIELLTFFKIIESLDIDTKEISSISLEQILNDFKTNQQYFYSDKEIKYSFIFPKININKKFQESFDFIFGFVVRHLVWFESQSENNNVDFTIEKIDNFLKVSVRNSSGKFTTPNVINRNDFFHEIIKQHDGKYPFEFGRQLSNAFSYRKEIKELKFLGENDEPTTIEIFLEINGLFG